MQYFVLPKCFIAFNAKVGSSALACAIVNKYYPHLLKESLDEYYRTWSQFTPEFIDTLPEAFRKLVREDKLDTFAFWQNICPRTKNPDGLVLLPIRDPVERFISTVAYFNMEAEKTLDALENDGEGVIYKLPINLKSNQHFWAQNILATKNTKYYKFPSQLEQLCKDAELDYPIRKVNEGEYIKPVLTKEQIDRVKKFYAEDVSLYESLPDLT